MKNIKQIEEWFLTSLLQHGQTLYQINNYAFYDGNKQLMLPQWTKQWMKSTAIFTLWGKNLEQNEQTVSEINSCSYHDKETINEINSHSYVMMKNT